MEPTGHYWKNVARYLKNIEWIKLNSTELNEFFKKNYLEKDYVNMCVTK